MCPYIFNVPQPNDSLRDSQADLLANFTQINTYLNTDHEAFNVLNQGHHKWVSFDERPIDPITPADQIKLYSKESVYSGDAELFMRRENNGDVIECTSSNQAATGWTYLPSGILLKWGGGLANGRDQITFPVAANTPVFNNVYQVQLTVYNNIDADVNQAIRLDLVVPPTHFFAYGSNRITLTDTAVNFFYLAIGD